MFEQLFAFLGASMVLTLSPGPDIIYVLVQSITHGKKAGILTAVGLVSGIIVHTTLLAFGVSLLIKESPAVFYGIKIIGACYLFFLAFKVSTSKADLVFSTDHLPQKNAFGLFRKGFLMNVINPKVLIFFLAFFPGFLWEPTRNTVLQFYILGAVFMLQAFLVFLLVAIAAGNIAGFFRKKKQTAVVFKWMQVLVFVGIGIFILI